MLHRNMTDISRSEALMRAKTRKNGATAIIFCNDLLDSLTVEIFFPIHHHAIKTFISGRSINLDLIFIRIDTD
jgi:hypothetical protein